MKILQRYFAREIFRAVFFVMLALLCLFSFFDLLIELQSLNQGNYRLSNALQYVLLGMPGYLYEFMPIAVLIGSIYVMAQFASNSEFTIMRAASLSSTQAGWMLFKVGLGFIIITFLFGELLAPAATRQAKKIKAAALGTSLSQEFRTGLWTKDLIRKDGLSGKVIGTRILNVKEVTPNRQLVGVKLFEFDDDFNMNREIVAQHGEYVGKNVWRLVEVTDTTFPKTLSSTEVLTVHSEKMPTKEIISEVTPNILSVLFLDPDRMSTLDLVAFTRHLAENKQDSERYEIALWKKITYPFAVLVMMALALPFAYLHARSGGVSFKIFTGIMIGMGFYLFNSLFSHLGLLNTWPAPVTAIVPSLVFLGLALMGLRYVERH
ncbi:MAG: LPS export ABC transporter permease LptG [Burkholderiaceae bacterium]|nr:LPS export ABC transporter permease LptG [Burkholderiaceae bacterium]